MPYCSHTLSYKAEKLPELTHRLQKPPEASLLIVVVSRNLLCLLNNAFMSAVLIYNNEYYRRMSPPIVCVQTMSDRCVEHNIRASLKYLA